MHHVRKIRDLRDKKSNKDFFTRQMEAINRKQIPLCQGHHTRLHNDTWSEFEKQLFKKIINEMKGKNKKKKKSDQSKNQ